MGKHSDYKKFTVAECNWCDYRSKRCDRKNCRYYRVHVKKIYKPRKKNNTWKMTEVQPND